VAQVDQAFQMLPRDQGHAASMLLTKLIQDLQQPELHSLPGGTSEDTFTIYTKNKSICLQSNNPVNNLLMVKSATYSHLT
jgi:hypothetical protein